MGLLMGYFVLINIIGIWVMHADKKRAIKTKYRIPEKWLWFIAVVGGAVGCTFGMLRFRHKTKHLGFRIGFPVFAVLQSVLLVNFLISFA